jgi:two-component system phosphate regulon sensor histidine kinase PhoR
MYYYAILLEDGNILRISRAADTALRTAVHILPIVLIIGAGLMLIGLLLTRRRLISLIDPINRIDLNEPMENDIYIELTPLLVRIDQQNKEKEELAQIRQEFSANVSHELRTPLTSISGYAEIIKNGIVRDRDIPEFADRIYREAQRMIALIEDIMRLSKLDEGALVQKEQVDLYAVADEVRGRLEHAAADRNIRLSLQGVHCRMRGFRQILDEMIYNLVDNAIKYNKERGSVLIQVNPQEDGILLSVRDTGIGIPDDARDRVFERFYRVDKSHSRQTGGTGLGLSIVKHGAMIHQASVRVDSTLGKGTDMQILFPPADPEDKAVPAAARD